MKKSYLNIAIFLLLTISLIVSGDISAQRRNPNQPVGQRYVGSQEYIRNNQIIMKAPTYQVSPTINSVYATPMQRVNEIPLYGKNKSTYFYSQQKKQEGMFSDSGLYLFGAFTTGTTNEGVNIESGRAFDAAGEIIGSNANDSMGDPTGITVGFGRSMSSALSIEFMYSNYTGMKYGNYLKYNGTRVDEDSEECIDIDGNFDEFLCPEISVVIDNDYEVTSGGKITSDFFGVGFKYNLNDMVGSLFSGMFKPYVGFQLGFVMNDLDDYTFSDPYPFLTGDAPFLDADGYETFNAQEANTANLNNSINPNAPSYYSDYSDGKITSIGANTNTFGYGLEAGVTIALESNMEIDFFFKRNMFGKVKSSGNLLTNYWVTQTDFYIVEDTSTACGTGYIKDTTFTEICWGPEYEGSEETNTKERNVEAGDMYMNQYGVKIRYMF